MLIARLKVRYLYLDNLRAILMMLGLVLHTCAAFSISQYWIIAYTEPLPWALALADAIHIFRMPLFFMVSGFFAFVLLQKQNVLYFCKIKFIRIGLPFLSVLLLINIPQFYILNILASAQGQDSANSIGITTNVITNGSGLKVTENMTSHLWFLINLIIYFVLYSCIHVLVRRIKVPKGNFKSAIFVLFMLLVVPVFYLCVLELNKVGIPIYFHIPIIGSLYAILSYFDYFLIGAMFALLSHHRMMDVFLSRLALIIFTPLVVIASLPWSLPNVINVITLPYIEHIQAVVVSLIIWLLATKMLANNSKAMLGLSKASYSIYLFHHGIIIALVYILNQLNYTNGWVINPYFAFFLVIGLSSLLTLIIHFYIVAKNKTLMLLFNGK
jgi:glucan biosynthesis protein C